VRMILLYWCILSFFNDAINQEDYNSIKWYEDYYMRWHWKVPTLLLRWEGSPRSHFWKPSPSVCHVTPCCEHTLFLYMCFFDFLHQVLGYAQYIYYQNPWNASWGFQRIFFKPDSGFWMTFTFQGRLSVSWKWWMFRATKHQQNDRKR
jgi:hypothetical protein